MRSSIKIGVIMLLGGAVAACGTSDIANMQVKGGAYESGLHKGYVKLADAEYEETDISDGNAFADRARLAAMGTPTGPEELNARSLKSKYTGDLSSARARLVSAMGGPAMAKVPADVADAQVAFDCWMQEAEEDMQPAHIAACRKDFDAAMARIDAVKMPPVAMKAPPPAPARVPATRNFVVYFPLDSDKIAGGSEKVLSEAAAFAKAKRGANVYLVGHADKSGSGDYNMKLSEKRVKAVSAELGKLGLRQSALGSLAQGENDPAVATRDGVAEAKNRRVVISVVY